MTTKKKVLLAGAAAGAGVGAFYLLKKKWPAIKQAVENRKAAKTEATNAKVQHTA